MVPCRSCLPVHQEPSRRQEERLLQIHGRRHLQGADDPAHHPLGYDADYQHDGGESYITGIYTIKNGRPHAAYAGRIRGSCQRLDDTRFFSTLSGGVSLTVFGDFRLSDDGCDMVWDDFYFTDEKENGSIEFYHNKTGVIDAGLSEEMKNGDEIFNGIMDDLARNCIRIDWTPIGARDQWGLA
ncbi:MAG: hypothetical protein E7423_02265 [Ruminococcaceae bacterium]|nr:hypothetical protein [Oscillospiraceae bacterium]